MGKLIGFTIGGLGGVTLISFILNAIFPRSSAPAVECISDFR